MLRVRGFWIGVLLSAMGIGCAQLPRAGISVNRVTLKKRALACLEAGVHYAPNPAVRVEAVEALESSAAKKGLPWIRAALHDEHPAVRFAACIAVGRLRDAAAEHSVRACLAMEDRSLQVAALFALHDLGHQERTGRMPNYLLNEKDAMVRRNAALLLGLLDEPAAVKVLARAMRDPDVGVRHQALEAMARLGNHEARQELVFMTNAGVGADEVFAISALAQTGDAAYLETYRYKLSTASHLETRLAAARALGKLGFDEGFTPALHALQSTEPVIDDPNDPAAGQRLRIRQMAAAALGAIGRVDALPALAKLMMNNKDPRIQISAARAVLDILEAERMHGIGLPGSRRFSRG